MAGEEYLESKLRGEFLKAESGHKGLIGVLQSRSLFGGIGSIGENSMTRSTKLRQISQVVGPFLNQIKDWDAETTPQSIAAFLLEEAGCGNLKLWYETHRIPFTEDRRVVAVKAAIDVAVSKATDKS